MDSLSTLIHVIFWEGYGYWVIIGSKTEFHNIADLPRLDSYSLEEQNLMLGNSCKTIDMKESGPLISDRHRMSAILEKIYWTASLILIIPSIFQNMRFMEK